MLEFIFGVALGVGAMVIREKLLNENVKNEYRHTLSDLSDENENLRRKITGLEKELDDLTRERKKYRKESEEKQFKQYDLEDDLEDAQSLVQELELKNKSMENEIAEYKIVCENYKAEIDRLKKL